MKKLFFTVMTVVCVSISNAQSFDPLLAVKLQDKMESIRAANNLRGISACIIYPGVGTWKGVCGFSHAGVPITAEMEFGIGSNTKLFTGVLLLKLAEKKLLSLDDPLKVHLPNFNNINPNITIRQLLNHTSGIAEINDIVGYSDSILGNPNRIFTPSEVMTWVGTPQFTPGTSWSYCNTNYLLAGMIAESATGQSYGQLLHELILSPLQLDSTFLDVYDNIPFAIAHPWQGGVDKSAVPRKALNSVAWSAGAMYSTASEMVQWYQALMKEQFLTTPSFGELTTFVGPSKYGIGLFSSPILGRTVWQHGGTIWGGYNSSMLYDTAAGIIVGVLVNQLPGQALQVSTQLLSTILDHVVNVSDDLSGANTMVLYPNPAEDLVQVDLPFENLQRIRLFDSKGRVVAEHHDTRFSVANLRHGLYFIAIQTAQGTYFKTLAKQ